MTDLALTDAAPPAPRRKGRKLLLLALPLLAAGAGAAGSYLDYVSPLAMVGLGADSAEAGAKAEGGEHGEAAAGPGIAFVDLPDINVSLPGAQPRMLHLAVKLETDAPKKAEVEHLLPRVSDAFNTFLTGISPQAFDRRGILEVIRDELTTRAREAIGNDIRVDVLVTEFALK